MHLSKRQIKLLVWLAIPCLFAFWSIDALFDYYAANQSISYADHLMHFTSAKLLKLSFSFLIFYMLPLFFLNKWKD